MCVCGGGGGGGVICAKPKMCPEAICAEVDDHVWLGSSIKQEKYAA